MTEPIPPTVELLAPVALSAEQLAAIDGRADEATWGPWSVGYRWEDGDDPDLFWLPIIAPSADLDDPHQPQRVALIRYRTRGFNYPHGDARADAEFIAHARTDVPALRAEVARLSAEVARFRAHSVALNSITWKLAKALGEVPAGATGVDVDPEGLADRVVARVTDARRHLAEVRALLEAYEESSNTIAGHIPEHYEGSEGAQIAIVEEWAGHAAAVVDAAHHWRKVPNEQTAAALDAAVEVIYPSEDYL